MSDLTRYLVAQAARQPLTTLRFAAAEVWRRGRMRWVNSIDHDVPGFERCAQGFAPFLASTAVLPEQEAITKAAADAICRHEFALLGSTYRAGVKIDWHIDWVTGRRWPCDPPDRLKISAGSPGSDVKRPWELSRFHHALPLGLAFAQSRDESYAQEFAAQITDWILQNPYPCGIHWAMPMEIGIRLVNLCVASSLFAGSTSLAGEFWHGLLSALFLHGRYLYLHREWNPVARGNHYLGCLAGLLHAGVLFGDLPEGKKWYVEAKEAISVEMNWQVGADGVAQEGSSGYHGFVTEMMLFSALLGARFENAAEFARAPSAAIRKSWGDSFHKKLESMFEFPAALLRGRREPPIWGDFDDGQLLPLCSADAHALEHLVATGGALFGREDWPTAHHCIQASCLIGSSTPSCTSASPRTAFPSAGFFLASSSRIQASVRCGPLGMAGWANHAHCDQLHVEFAVDGTPVLVDPGTYLYSGDPQARNLHRSSRAHNSPVVAGVEQNRFWDSLLFRMMDDTQSKALLWEETGDTVRFAGRHKGYHRLLNPVDVHREVHLQRAQNSLEICDTLSGDGGFPVEWFWQFAPNTEIQEVIAGNSVWRAGAVEFSARFEGTCSAIKASLREGWVSPRYGVRNRAPVLHFRAETAGQMQARFQFIPIDQPRGAS